MERHPVDDYVKSQLKANANLPPDTLVVSKGIVDEIQGDWIYHQVSTCPGMSGACLLYNGRAWGIFHLSYQYLTMLGIHIGTEEFIPHVRNKAISLKQPEISALIKKYHDLDNIWQGEKERGSHLVSRFLIVIIAAAFLLTILSINLRWI